MSFEVIFELRDIVTIYQKNPPALSPSSAPALNREVEVNSFSAFSRFNSYIRARKVYRDIS